MKLDVWVVQADQPGIVASLDTLERLKNYPHVVRRTHD